MSVWETLAIEPTNDLRTIKRAYAAKLKVTRPEDDAHMYQELREAFDAAKRLAKEYNYSEDQAEQSDELVVTGEELSVSNDQEAELEQGDPVIVDGAQDEPEPLTLVDSSLDLTPLVITESEGQLNKNQVETDVIEPEFIEPEPTEEEKIHKQVVDMVQAIHDCLVDQDEVAAVALFHQQLESPKLFSLDLSKRFDMQMMDYLGWWCSRHEDDNELLLPLGFMRHVLNHYAWHKDGVLSFQSAPALERNYESIVNDSAHGFLVKAANKELDYTPEYVAGAKRLLGKYKPKWFALVSIFGSHRDASDTLLERVENLNDSSFDFELNTKTVNWWRASRERFSFSFWMIVVAAIIAVSMAILILDLSTSYPQVNQFFASWITQVLIFLCAWFLAGLVVYGIAYSYKKISDFVVTGYNKFSGLQQELVLLTMAIPIAMAMYFIAPFLIESDIIGAYICGSVLLCVVYRRRVVDILVSMYFVTFAFNYETSLNALEHLNVLQIALPALFINTALHGGYVDFKAKQLGRRYVYSEISKRNCFGLEILLALSCVGTAFLLY